MLLIVSALIVFNCLPSIISIDSGLGWDLRPNDLDLGLGDSIVINCSAHGKPNPTISWFRVVNSSQDQGDYYYKPIGHGSTYTIDSVKLEDSGQYECKATSNKESINWMFLIKVYEGPRFSIKHNRVTAARGTKVTLSCEASGTKPIINTWHRQFSSGKLEPIELSSSSQSRYMINEGDTGKDHNRSLFNLHIDKVQLDDSGSYLCNANNDFGDDSMINVLIVQDVPSIVEGLKIDTIWTRSITLQWSAAQPNGSPIINYILEYWPGNGTLSEKTEQESIIGSQLTHQIKDKLEPGTVYSLRMVAENSIGRSLPSSIITFNTKEEIPNGTPIDIKVESKTTRSLEVTWKAPLINHWRGKLIGYHLTYKESADSMLASSDFEISSYSLIDISFTGEPTNKYQQKWTITGLKAGTTYSILIRAYNSAGEGPLSPPIFSSTSAFDPPKAPIIRNAEKKDSGFVVKLDEPSSNINVNYYKIYYKEENSSWLTKSFTVSKSNEYEIDGLKSNTWYYIYMIIDSDHGVSEPSQTINVKTLADSFNSDSLSDQHDYNYENDLRSAKYYGSFIVIPIAITIIIVVVICAVAYVFVYIEERKTDLIRSNYMTHTPATNFQYLSPLPASATLHHPTMMSTDNSVLSLHRYANDTIDRGQPLIPRTLISNKDFDTLKCYYTKRTMVPENMNQEYSTPYEARIFRERSSSLPPVPQSMQDNQRIAATINSTRQMPSQHIYMNGSQSSLASVDDCVKSDNQTQKDSDHRYDYFNFL